MLLTLLLGVSGLLSLAHCENSVDFDFGEFTDEEYEAMLRDNGFTEEEIQELLQEDKEDTEYFQDEDEDKISWTEAKGYEECEVFMTWKKNWDEKKEWDGKRHNPQNTRLRRLHGDRDEGKNCNESRHGHEDNRHKQSRKLRCSKPVPLSKVCARYECAPFEKLNSSGCGFEARRMLSANWTVTHIEVRQMSRGINEAFMRLFKYIRGANDQELKIAMTVPVVNIWFLDDDYHVKGGAMAFYIPSIHQSDPPTPTNDKVKVHEFQDVVAYDRAFGGHHMNPDFYKKEFVKLWTALIKAGITPYTRISITSGYTRPGWFRPQRNEVVYVEDQDFVKGL